MTFRKLKPHRALALGLALCGLLGTTHAATPRHGQLKVTGNKVTAADGSSISLMGMSYFWSNSGWGGERYYNANTVKYLKNNWKASIVRAAMGVNESGGYLHDSSNKQRVKTVVDAAISEGLYVLIDFHCHTASDYTSQAKAFFQEMARTYGNQPNIIYEIWNEPLQVSWSSKIKPYAETIISAIRAIDPDNLIIVGTPTWSQDVDVAALDPITGYSNIAYTCHFYANTHKQYLRDKIKLAMDRGIAVMVTEWGTCDASGNGGFNATETKTWLTFMKNNGISHCNWALNDKTETASALANGASTSGNWADSALTASGLLVRNAMRTWNDDEAAPAAQLIANGTYAMKSKSGIFLSATRSGAPLKSRSGKNGNFTQWKFKHLGSNVYEISSLQFRSQRMEVPYGTTGNGQKVAITAYTGEQEHIKWKATQKGPYFQFEPMHNLGYALDAYSAKPAVVRLYSKQSNNPNQLFKLIK